MLHGEMVSQDDHNEMSKVMKMREDYFSYIKDHIDNVLKAYTQFFENLNKETYKSEKIHYDDIIVAIRNCKVTIQDHDTSKYSDEEFEPYRRKFHPTEFEKVKYEEDEIYRSFVDETFDLAWIHHYTNNSHHPLYWKEVASENIKDMSLEAIIEMICDWEAMSMKFNTDTIEWYKTKADKEKSQMTEKTKEIVEEILFNIIH